MTIQTNEQANAYALRMYNDDYWNKEYIPKTDAIIKIDHPDPYLGIKHRYLLPVWLNLWRYCVGDDDSDQYPNGTDDELDELDQGKISILFYIAIDKPFSVSLDDRINDFEIAGEIGSCVNYFIDGFMDGGISLSRKATQHIMYRLSDHDMISDTFQQNNGLLSVIQREIQHTS